MPILSAPMIALRQPFAPFLQARIWAKAQQVPEFYRQAGGLRQPLRLHFNFTSFPASRERYAELRRSTCLGWFPVLSPRITG